MYLILCSVMRRSTTLLVVAGEARLFGKRPTRRSLAALLVMLGGAVVAGLSDLTFRCATNQQQQTPGVRAAVGGIKRTGGTAVKTTDGSPWLGGSPLTPGLPPPLPGGPGPCSLPGYVWVSICVASTAAYLLCMKQLENSAGAARACGRS